VSSSSYDLPAVSPIPFDSCITDPLVHHGRHFCRTVHALCNIQALLTNGLLRSVELAETPDESFTTEQAAMLFTKAFLLMCNRERREHSIYQELMKTVPGLEERLMTSSEDELSIVAELVIIE
jgi:hypothetical protein